MRPGFFYNIRVADRITAGRGGADLHRAGQAAADGDQVRRATRSTAKAKLRKKVTSKVGEPLDERKLFTDSQEIQKMYQKAGYPRTEVKYVLNIDENAGRGTATFEIKESPKVKIIWWSSTERQAFTEKKLRKVIKTRKHWMFSWLTGSGHLKDEQFEEDKEKLAEFYRDNGYIDFEIKDVEFRIPTPKTMIIRFHDLRRPAVQGRVGQLPREQDVQHRRHHQRHPQRLQPAGCKLGPNGLPMDVGDVFTPKGLTKDIEAIEDFYGSKGYIDVSAASRNLHRSQHSQHRHRHHGPGIQDRGRPEVLHREDRDPRQHQDQGQSHPPRTGRLPGEIFDMVRVKLSKHRLEGLQYFEKVDARPEPTDVPNRKNLVVSVEEKNTGNMTVGAGFSSVDSLVGFAEVTQGNFDLFNPPTFTGGGQKFRLRCPVRHRAAGLPGVLYRTLVPGTQLALGVDLLPRLDYQSWTTSTTRSAPAAASA